MNATQLFTQFHSGISWNGILYITYKSLTTFQTFLLFQYLPSHDFTLWATTNSIIFLILLWADCGLRKSLPRFAPEFSCYKNGTLLFTRSILIFQAMLLGTTLPLCLYLISKLCTYQHQPFLLYWAAILFISEGFTLLMQLIFHSYFWHKKFNRFFSAIMLVETGITLVLIFFFRPHIPLLPTIFIIKIVSCWIINGTSIIMLPSLYKDQIYKENQDSLPTTLWYKFIKHSGAMWISTILKSISERNFLQPFLLYAVGSTSANLFKVANDGALLFYRSIKKTVGTTDTSLLAHSALHPNRKILLPLAFSTITRKILLLCLPPIVIIAGMLIKQSSIFCDPLVLNIFLLITTGYLIELLLSPCERILETQGNYQLLAISYTPYIATLATLIISGYIFSIGLFQSLMIVHGARLISSFVMTYHVYTTYGKTLFSKSKNSKKTTNIPVSLQRNQTYENLLQ